MRLTKSLPPLDELCDLADLEGLQESCFGDGIGFPMRDTMYTLDEVDGVRALHVWDGTLLQRNASLKVVTTNALEYKSSTTNSLSFTGVLHKSGIDRPVCGGGRSIVAYSPHICFGSCATYQCPPTYRQFEGLTIAIMICKGEEGIHISPRIGEWRWYRITSYITTNEYNQNNSK